MWTTLRGHGLSWVEAEVVAEAALEVVARVAAAEQGTLEVASLTRA